MTQTTIIFQKSSKNSFYRKQITLTSLNIINPLSPTRDQHQIYSNNINTSLIKGIKGYENYKLCQL